LIFNKKFQFIKNNFTEDSVTKKSLLTCYFVIISSLLYASPFYYNVDTLPQQNNMLISKQINEKDLTDIFHSIIKKRFDSTNARVNNKYHLSLLPAAGYTLQTGMAGVLSTNIGFYNHQDSNAKISTISSSITYSQYNQTLIPFYADIWLKKDKVNFISDNRYIAYPSNIYGLGGRTDPNRAHTINFRGLKLHDKVLFSFSKNWFVGTGIYYDQFWDISVVDPTTKRINTLIEKELGTNEIAVGPVVNVLYDSRTNQINATSGTYFNINIRDNLPVIGSGSYWQSILIDTRKYFNLPRGSRNTLAFWSYEWLTLGGDPPYLLKPATGWDDQYNTGRGYIQSRFRGNNMSYVETEYRFGLSKNGLFSGVFFVNAEKFSDELSSTYKEILPGYGLGLRIKLNKFAKTNICIDYGFGNNSSQGFFVNLGEVF
jgi:hypothetical protein